MGLYSCSECGVVISGTYSTNGDIVADCPVCEKETVFEPVKD